MLYTKLGSLDLEKKNPKIAGFFALLPFLTYLCYTRLKPSTHCVQLRRKIAKIERTLSKYNDRCINGMFVFTILVRALNKLAKCRNILIRTLTIAMIRTINHTLGIS